MSPRYVAFDLEIANEIPTGAQDWRAAGPLRISCAATLTETGDLRLWHGGNGAGEYAPAMTPEQVGELVAYLDAEASGGRLPLTWNGLGFDFAILADEAPASALSTCHRLALDHLDMAFQMLCEKGVMCGLDAAAKGMGLSGKTEGMHGDLAPVMWKQGRQDQDRVLEYVAQDVRITAWVYEAILKADFLRWITKAGGSSAWTPTRQDDRLLTAREALALPLPDTAWLRDPWPRSKFCGWIGELQALG
jgi:hypothetical protein